LNWDPFDAAAKNSTFLFLRDYMDYHAARFTDHSLLFYENENLVAVLPATLQTTDNTLVSHGGLTFGGVVSGAEMTVALMLDLFDELGRHLRRHGVTRLVYKALPHIYSAVPAEEDRYALFRVGAKLFRRDVTATVALDRKMPFQERRLRGVKKALAAGLAVRRTADLALFWPILEENLRRRHGVRPVHTLSEIQLLQQRFPENIKLFAVYQQESLLAGVVVYEHPRVAHAQYISSNEVGRRLGALDLLFDHLISEYYQHHAYFDFGISTQDEGRVLNVGLSEQKEGFGARAVVHDFYEIDFAARTAA
jgi:hypothetical protein